MINYVNNSFDNVLKPCDAQQFYTLTQSEKTERLILAHRAGEPKAKSKLPALTYMGVFDKDKYRKYLAKCEAQGTKPLSPRHAEFMRPTGLLMLDFDHVGDAKALYEQLAGKMDMSRLALAHITPSGDGLRLVMQRAKGKSIQQEQHDFCQAMGVQCDDVCKDISRLSYAPMKSEVLYFNPSLLFAELPDASDYPDGSLWGASPDCPLSLTPSPCGDSPLKRENAESAEGANQKELSPFKGDERNGVERNVAEGVSVDANHTTSPLRGTPPILGGESYPTDYNGIEYSEIIRRLEEQLGGRPAQGARNSFIFTMACNLRYICNDDAAWVASILPTYGEEPQKHRATIQSAINRPMSRNMPETLKRALQVASESSEVADGDSQPSTLNPHPEALPPAMPTILPEPIALLTSRTPERMKAAVAMAVFPPLGAHVKDLQFAYIDGRDYEPTFMSVLVAELSSGKSAVNTPIDYIIADIEARDEVAREKERRWRETCEGIANPADKPKRPDGLGTQILASDMTNAAFVLRLSEAENKFLYTQMDEIELLNALKTNTQSGSVSAILRLAFDCGKYGQERVAANAVNAKVRVRWNWNASTTVQRVRKYFAKSIADGTLSRLAFSTIIEDEDNWGEEVPHYAQYGEHFAEELKGYIDRLTSCSGTLHCPEAIEWALALNREQVAFARDADDRAYAKMSRRSLLMGFYRAMLLYVMNGMRWSDEIATFAAWSVRYDMWCKMRFFRDMLHRDLDGEKNSLQRGPVGLLSMLPKEFTREQVRDLRIAQGLRPNPRNQLASWVSRGHIVKDEERDVFIKV